MPGAMRNTAIATGKKMAWNMNFEGTGPSKVVQSVVAEPSAAAIASAMSGSWDRLGGCEMTELVAGDEKCDDHNRPTWSRVSYVQ